MKWGVHTYKGIGYYWMNEKTVVKYPKVCATVESILLVLLSLYQTIVSILLYGCTTWTLTKRLEKKLDGNYTRMQRAKLNKSWRQHPTKQQLYGHLPPITKTIQVRRTRHTGHCWRNRDEIISDVLLWTPSHGRAKAGGPARTYIEQLCEDTGWSPKDLLERRGGERGSGISVLMTRQDDDDDYIQSEQ